MQDVAASTKQDMQDVTTRFAHQSLVTLPAPIRFVNIYNKINLLYSFSHSIIRVYDDIVC
jgi:hypothetical protein